jgi:hypothetical protein
VIEIKMHLKIRIFIFALALLLIAPDRYAYAMSYNMFVYSELHYSYVVQGIEVQKRILDAFSGGALLPVLVIFFVYCLFMWVRRISEKGDVLNFAVWFFAFFIMSYMTFYAKTDIRINVYKWEQATKTQHVNYFTTIKDAPGINSFFAQATKFVTILTHAILGRTIDKDVADAIASCAPLMWYLESLRATLIHISIDESDPSRAAQLLYRLRRESIGNLTVAEKRAQARAVSVSPRGEDFKVPRVPITPGMFDPRAPVGDEAIRSVRPAERARAGDASKNIDPIAKFADEVRKHAGKCNLPDDPENRAVVQIAKQGISYSVFNNVVFQRFQEMIQDAPSSLKPAHKIAGVLGDTGSPAFTNFVRDTISWLARLVAPAQFGLNLRIYTMLMIQSVATAFFFLLFPLFLLFSFAAINDYTYGINWKVLLGFLVAFFLVQSWYPAIMFVKALVFRHFMM